MSAPMKVAPPTVDRFAWAERYWRKVRDGWYAQAEYFAALLRSQGVDDEKRALYRIVIEDAHTAAADAHRRMKRAENGEDANRYGPSSTYRPKAVRR